MPDETRILHMIGSLAIGGSQAFVMNIYRKIDREKFQFDFIVDSLENNFFADEIEKMGGKVFYLPKFNGKNYFKVKNAWHHFFDEHKEYRVLHSHVRSYASLYIPIAKKHGVKTIIHSHSTSNGNGVASIVKCVMQYPLRYQADYLMACSNEAGQWLFGKKACKRSNYYFIPNAIDVEQYRFRPEIADKYRKELGVKDKFVVGHVGRFHEAKNHMFLLNFFAEIVKRRSDAVLLLVGDGDLRSSIETKIKELQIEDRVILAGSRGDVAEIMSAMDVFVFPSKWEGLGIAAIEAQAAGLPCLCSEYVPPMVAVTDLCKFIPLNEERWVEAALSVYPARRDTYYEIVNAGFENKNTAKKIEVFYKNLTDNVAEGGDMDNWRYEGGEA